MLLLYNELGNNMDKKEIKKITARDIMTEKVITIKADTPLLEVAKLLAEYTFDGIPVIDNDRGLIGLVTEYDLINKASAVHLPTLQIVLRSLPEFKKEAAHFWQEILSLRAADVMNKEPLTLPPDASYEEILKLFLEHHRVNPVPVVDKEGKLLGVISRFDVLRPLHVVMEVLEYSGQ